MIKPLLFLEASLRDLRYAARVLRKNLAFTCVVVFTLALAIGGNTAIFGVLDSQLWRPLPFPDSERLADIHLVLRTNPRESDVLPNSVYRAWHEQNHSLEKIGAFSYGLRNLTAGGTSERIVVMSVTASLFDTLRLPVQRGRNFLPDEETTGLGHVAILSHELWQTRFGSNSGVIGTPIKVDGDSYVIVGIASPRLRFEYFFEPALYIPLATDSTVQALHGYIIGRLARGVQRDVARTELDGILQRQLEAEGAKQEDAVVVGNLRGNWTDFAVRPLFFYMGAILLVLLIACFNSAGLLLARNLARQQEFALRTTLGATRQMLIRQSLAESLLLSLAGGTAGALLSIWGSRVFGAFWSGEGFGRHAKSYWDAHVLLFVLSVSIFSALLMGTIPALFSARVNLTEALRKRASGVSADRSRHRTRNVLVAAEVAVALVLLFGTGLFLSSFLRERQAPHGFDAPGAMTFHISLRGGNYAEPDQQRRYFRRLEDQIRGLPGVQDVTFGNGIPLRGSSLDAFINVAGRPFSDVHGVRVILYAVEPNFFNALHIRLLSGRTLSSQDTETSPRVAILNRNASHTLFGSEDPEGKVLEYVPDERRGIPAEPPVQIIGVTENTQEDGPNEAPFDVLYVPFAQHPSRDADFVVSSRLPSGTLLDRIRNVTSSLDKDQPLYGVKTIDQLIGESLSDSKFDLLLVGCLAAIALTLVAVGIFGTVAYFVQQRTQEFGVRIALGASPVHVLRHAISHSCTVGVAGLVGGVASALALGRILHNTLYLVPHEHDGMLYGVKIYDPLSISLACVLLLVVLALASFIPARRALGVDPAVALRRE